MINFAAIYLTHILLHFSDNFTWDATILLQNRFLSNFKMCFQKYAPTCFIGKFCHSSPIRTDKSAKVLCHKIRVGTQVKLSEKCNKICL